MIGIVVSRADSASVHIGDRLRSLAEWRTVEEGVYRREGFELREFEPLHLELNGVASVFSDPDYIVVASRHSGDTGPLLSAHFTGNFGRAEFGGSDHELAETCPGALRRVIGALEEHAPPGYDVSMECTHHGPSNLGAPGMYVELGSSETEWEDPEGAEAVARSILDLQTVAPESNRTVVAFGGNHYAPKPTRIVSETEFGMGHVAADWSLEAVDDPEILEGLVEGMFELSGATCAVFDGDLPDVREIVSDLGYRIVSERWVRETSGYDPALVDELEVALGSVQSGLRFGTVAAETGAFLIVDLPRELIEECEGIDREATVSALADRSLAYQTLENGNRVGDRAAFASRSTYDGFVDDCRTILESAYDDVRHDGEELVAERLTFDPDLAASLGVPEGPKFGALASGQEVSVDGNTIDPESAQTREIRRFSV